jgi:fructokinase
MRVFLRLLSRSARYCVSHSIRSGQIYKSGDIKMKYTIIGLGEILWDMLPSGKQLGGAPANFAHHANALGNQGVVVSAVGEDKLGHQILRQLKNLCLNRRYVAINKTKPTGTVSVTLDDKGHPSYTIHQQVAWDFIAKTPSLKKLAKRTHAVCFGSLAQRSYLSRNTIQTFLKDIPSEALRIFDINLRQSFYSKEIIDSSLRLANVFKINEEELAIVANLLLFAENQSERTILKLLAIRYNLRLIALTKGDKGSLLYSEGQFSTHRGYPTQVVDTVGAGDSFTAALTVGMLKKHKLGRINDNANRLAAFVCSQTGATPKY